MSIIQNLEREFERFDIKPQWIFLAYLHKKIKDKKPIFCYPEVIYRIQEIVKQTLTLKIIQLGDKFMKIIPSQITTTSKFEEVEKSGELLSMPDFLLICLRNCRGRIWIWGWSDVRFAGISWKNKSNSFSPANSSENNK